MSTPIQITAEEAADTLLRAYSEIFAVAAEDWKELVGQEVFYETVWAPFGTSLAESFIAGNVTKIPEILNYIEILMTQGTERLQNAVATYFLENVLSVADANAETMRSFLGQLGPESKDYCRAWNEYRKIYNIGL